MPIPTTDIPDNPYTLNELTEFTRMRVFCPQDRVYIYFMRNKQDEIALAINEKKPKKTDKFFPGAICSFRKANLADPMCREATIKKIRDKAGYAAELIGGDSIPAYHRDYNQEFATVTGIRRLLASHEDAVHALRRIAEDPQSIEKLLPRDSIRQKLNNIAMTRIQNTFAEELTRLPAWYQVVLVEATKQHRRDPLEIIVHPYAPAICGLSAFGTYAGPHHKDVDNSTIHTSSPFFVGDFHNIAHEAGHFLTQYTGGEARLDNFEKLRHLLKKPATREIARMADYINTYKEDRHSEEIVVRLLVFYLDEFKKYKGDNQRVEEAMHKAYPELWPSFRDNQLARFMEYAEREYKNMQRKALKSKDLCPGDNTWAQKINSGLAVAQPMNK